MPDIVIYEILTRGAVAGLCLVLSVNWLRRGRDWASRLGALFALGLAAYVLISSPVTTAVLGPALIPLQLLAIFNSVFFWWFILALFDDDFHWKAWFWIPAIVLAATLPFRMDSNGDTPEMIINIIHQMVVVPILIHAIILAVRDFSTDLIEPRRRFRLALATLIPAMGILIVIGEVYADILGGDLSPNVYLSHAVALLLLIMLFALWALVPRDELFGYGGKPSTTSSTQLTTSSIGDLTPEDRIELDRLAGLMTEGVYCQEGLTVGGLATKVGIPEHRLRKLINQGLGHRNFAAYLNSHRIADARKILADPEKARQQIIQVALDLGYASLSPFNRAFKLETGQTPSEFRRVSLADSEKPSPIS